MKKDMIVLIVRVFMSLAGLICLALCIALPSENQALLSAGLALNTIALILSFMPKRDK